MKKQDPILEEMLRDLGRALSEAILVSPDATRTLRRIRQEGYRLRLVLDCLEEGNLPEPLIEPPRPSEPSFQINTTDLSFLRSIGIDPTRRLRRRRKR